MRAFPFCGTGTTFHSEILPLDGDLSEVSHFWHQVQRYLFVNEQVLFNWDSLKFTYFHQTRRTDILYCRIKLKYAMQRKIYVIKLIKRKELEENEFAFNL